MVLKNLKRIAEGKGDDEQKGNSENPSGQKKSKTSSTSEHILHLTRGEKSCFMIGSNPDSQYKVPKTVQEKLPQPWDRKLTENERVG